MGGSGSVTGTGRALLFLTFALHLTKLFSSDTLLQGSNITFGDSLISPNHSFKLHFFPVPFSSPGDTGKSYLGITMGETRIWVANLNNPVDDHSDPRLVIDDYGNLKILYNGGSDSIKIYSSEAAHPVNAKAYLLETGDFKLQETHADGSVKVVWKSFDYPNNILLPWMRLGFNRKTGQVWNLTSWVGPNTPALGSFTLVLDPDNTKQLAIWWQGKIYWTSGPVNEAGRFPNLKLKSTQQESWFPHVSSEIETYFTYVALSAQNDAIVLDSQGQLTGGASVLCSSYDPAPVDGCVPMARPNCRNPDAYVNLGDFKRGYMNENGYKSEGTEKVALYDCGAMCFKNCSCSFFSPTTQDNTGCQMWNRGSRFVESPDGRPIYFIQNKFDTFTNTTIKGKSKVKKVWIASVAGGALAILTSFCICHLLLKKAKERSKQNMLLSEIRGIALPSTVICDGKKFNKNELTSHEIHIFSFESLVEATNNFSSSNKLGEGGFGPVYKGQVLDGQEIAIKRLSRDSRQGLTEFKNEIKLIAKLQHPNFVRLHGFCIEKEERMLIYEYLPNKSLDFHLFDSSYIIVLDWKIRHNIIQGIAQTLLYLHKSSNLGVIHRDLKTSNILLDHEMKPKISNFGTARIFGLKESEEVTDRVVGTFGYMPPEYVSNGVISTKTDVFSFGVLLLEIVSGKKNYYCSSYPHNLVRTAWQLWNEGRALQLLDPILSGTCTDNEILRYIHLGLLCVQDQAKDRPTIEDVVSFLSNETAVLAEPKFLPNIIVNANKLPDNNEENCSSNDASISPLEGR